MAPPGGSTVVAGAHNLLSATHPDTTPSAPSKGSIITSDGSTWLEKNVGSDGQVLTADSSQADGVKWVSGSGGGGLVLLEQHAASASASLDFTTFVSSSYDEYEIHIVGLIPASASDLWMRMSTDGGATYDTSGVYANDSFVWRAGGSAVGGGTAATKCILSFAGGSNQVQSSTTHVVNAHMRLFDPASASAYKAISGSVSYFDGNRVRNEFRDAYESTTAVNAVRFLMSTGNITSGTIRIYGVQK